MEAVTLRQQLARRLRFTADRIDRHGAPKHTHWTFTFEDREGIRFREDGRGCPVWYCGDDDYERAHTEADTEHVQVNWVNATAARVGGQP